MKWENKDIEFILEHLRKPESLLDPDFNLWLEEEQHYLLFEEIRNQKEAFLRYENQENIQVEKEYLRFKTNIKHRHSLGRWGWAAAILLLIGYAVFWLSDIQPNPLLITQHEEYTGKKSAVLILSNGKQVELENNNVQFQEKNGTYITNDTNCLLAYRQDTSALTPETEPEYHTLRIPAGADYILSLTDGTRVHLNCESEFRFPVTFTGPERKVFLNGEAFFEVRKAEEWPFIVVTDEMDIRVTGTRFNVKAYQQDNQIATTLVEGSVVIRRARLAEDCIQLKPSQQFRLDKTSGETELTDVDVSLYTGWIEGMFVFKNQRLEEVMDMLARWYSVKVIYIHDSVKDLRLSANLGRYEHIDTLLQLIEAMNKIKIEREENVVILSWK